jgi:hypothetical protein
MHTVYRLSAQEQAERSLFRELTELVMSLRDAPYGSVESAIEERFRAFVREAEGPAAPRSLQLTLTWTLPEGADGWALQSTEYRTLRAEVPDIVAPLPPSRPLADGGCVIPFNPRLRRVVR